MFRYSYLVTGPRFLKLGNGAAERKFDAFPQQYQVTESTNINSLAEHSMWSTIKTLPATLPKPSFMDRGPRTGVTGAVS